VKDLPALSSAVEVPPTAELWRLREEGRTIGYRGAHIYLRYLAILEVLAGMRFRRALGVGTGYGIFDRLLPADLDYTGVDVDAAAVAYAARWAAQAGRRFSYRALPLAACGFPTGQFDLVILSEVIEHVPEPEVMPLLAEVQRVLSPGGHLLLTVPNRLHLRNRARRCLGLPLVWMDPTHLREYTLSEAEALVRELPLRLRELRPAVLYFPGEPWVGRVVRPESRLRRLAIRRLPRIASHFIFLLQA
jgi:SAM-dependent methyltransferase